MSDGKALVGTLVALCAGCGQQETTTSVLDGQGSPDPNNSQTAAPLPDSPPAPGSAGVGSPLPLLAGRLTLSVTDAPFPRAQVAEALVTFEEIQGRVEASPILPDGWHVLSTETRTIDILPLTGGLT